jgi:hypothetical protein
VTYADASRVRGQRGLNASMSPVDENRLRMLSVLDHTLRCCASGRFERRVRSSIDCASELFSYLWRSTHEIQKGHMDA